MRSTFLVLAALCLFARCAPRAMPPPTHTTVFIVRHAEKQDASDPDSRLSAAGHARARELADRLKDEDVRYIYATTKVRTQETVAPLAQLRGITPVVLDPYALEELAVGIRTLAPGSAVLVAGHSNSVPDIVQRLSGQAVEAIPEHCFDRLYKVTMPRDGAATLEVLRFGAPTP